MDNGTHMNYLALNQNILFKQLRFFEGPEEGTQLEPIQGFNNLSIYLNGKHNISEFIDEDFEITNGICVGHLTHPYAMDGMPGQSGVLAYDFCESEEYHLIIVRLKLDEGTNGKSEPASDFLSIVKKSEVPASLYEDEYSDFKIAGSMLFPHLDRLFEFYESYESLIEADFEIEKETALDEMIKQFFKGKK